MSSQQIKTFQQEILSWFAKNERDLPWRHTRDPYKILVSEVMSQQTQLARVIPKYQQWMKTFPTVQSLAKATTREVLTLWSGLGYNRRALYLQKIAQIIVEKFGSKFPEDEKVLQKLPGIGRYTARALLCFAFGKPLAVVDTNVRRVILTQFHKRHCEERTTATRQSRQSTRLLHQSANWFAMTDRDVQQIANQLLPQGYAYEWNQALMDYSSAVLKKEKIPVPKQSKFKDSDRYYRGQIIKLLINKKKATSNEMNEHFASLQTTIEKKRLEAILKQLEKDLLMTQDSMSKSYQLP